MLDIVGDNLVCSESLFAHYSTTEEGVYKWTAVGGEISGVDNSKDVNVLWNKWGMRKIKLNVTNLCNSFDANPIEIIPVELITEIKITTDSNASEICWNITDCDGNLVFSYCDLPLNTEYTKRLALPPGCYIFNLNTGSSVVAAFSVNDACEESNIFSARDFSGDYSKTFQIASSENTVEFNLYPNPVQTELNIEAAYYELYEDASFSITNLAGMIVVPEQKLAGNTKIRVDNLPRGLYIIEINTSRGKFAGRILVGYGGPE
jgi:hypothetical protein